MSKIRSHRRELNNLGVQKIGLFGSYARNEQSANSDIDILIELQAEKESFDAFMAIYDYIEDLFAHQKVEIITKNGLSPYIGPFILKEVVYA